MPEQLNLSSGLIIGEILMALEGALAGSWMSAVSFPVTSKQKVQQYKWLGMAPGIREWIGGRHPHELRGDGYSIENVKYEGTLEIEVDDLNRDQWGQIRQRIADFGKRPTTHWEILGSSLLALGHSQLCYDGLPFFSDAHVEGESGVQTNLLTVSDVPALNVGTATAPTPVEMAQAVLGCIAHQYGLKDDQGYPINGDARNFLLMLPVSLWSAAVGPAIISLTGGGSILGDNPLAQMAKAQNVNIVTVPNPLLTWTTDFCLLRTDAAAKPLIRQEEYPVKVSAKAEGSEYEHDFDRHQYGLKLSRNVGYAFWQYALKATLS
jgi:phage major head subunit gpT-like protein